jgi:L-asparaginase
MQHETDHDKDTIIVLSCGGTINMVRTREGNVNFSGVSSTPSILNVPAVHHQTIDAFQLVHQPFLTLPSSEMSIERVLNLSKIVMELDQEKKPAGIVITHGTDALEDTAFVLGLTLPHQLHCPVVLTAAMRPITDPNYDGSPNLQQAITWISQTKTMNEFSHINPVVIMNQQAHPSTQTFKQHTHDLTAFNNQHSCIAHFDSNTALWQRTQLPPEITPIFGGAIQKNGAAAPRVEIISFYPGDDASTLKAVATHVKPRAVVINALGCGNVNQTLLKEIEILIQSGIIVVIASRTPYGSSFAEYAYAGGGASLKKVGAIFSGRLRANQAKLLLQLCFLDGLLESSQISKQFEYFGTTRTTT